MAFGESFDVAVPGGVLAGLRWPADAPRVVFLHAGVADRRCWYAVIDELPGRVDAIGYDRRGYGETPAGTTVFRHVDDLAAVVEACGAPVVLVGNSAGGAVALDFALEHPDRVSGMLLIAPSISGSPQIDTADPATLVLSDRIEKAYDDRDWDSVVRLESWLWLDGPGAAEGRVSGAPRILAEEMNRRVLTHETAEDAGSSGLDTWSRLGEIAVPTIVVAGELDVPKLIERSRDVGGRLADAAYRALSGVAHLPSLEAPEVIAGLVEEIVERVG